MSGIFHSATSMAASSEQMNVSGYKIRHIKIMQRHYYGPFDIFKILSIFLSVSFSSKCFFSILKATTISQRQKMIKFHWIDVYS